MLEQTSIFASEEKMWAMSFLRNICHWSGNMTAVVDAGGFTELKDITTDSVSMQSRIFATGNMTTKIYQGMYPQLFPATSLGCNISANLWDRNGGVMLNKIQHTSGSR